MQRCQETLLRICLTCFLLLTGIYISCHHRVDERYYLPSSLHVTDGICLGQSISYLEDNGLLNYDEYCDCYYHEAADDKAYRFIHLNRFIKGDIVKSMVLEYGRQWDDFENERIAHELIDTLIREYGEDYIILDVSTLSFEGRKRPRIEWRTDEGVDVSVSFIPRKLFEKLREVQVPVISQVELEFRMSDTLSAKSLEESTIWTRDALGLTQTSEVL